MNFNLQKMPVFFNNWVYLTSGLFHFAISANLNSTSSWINQKLPVFLFEYNFIYVTFSKDNKIKCKMRIIFSCNSLWWKYEWCWHQSWTCAFIYAWWAFWRLFVFCNGRKIWKIFETKNKIWEDMFEFKVKIIICFLFDWSKMTHLFLLFIFFATTYCYQDINDTFKLKLIDSWWVLLLIRLIKAKLKLGF